MRLIILILLCMTVIISACSIPGLSGLSSGSSSVSGGSGINMKFIDAPKNGEEIIGGDTFSIVLRVENGIPGKTGLTGTVCLRDSTTDTYGGIPSNTCRPVNLRAADITSTGILSTFDELRFPEVGFYSYHNLDPLLSLDNQVYADFNYDIETTSVGNICVSRPRSSSPSIPSGCGDTQSVSLTQPSGVPLVASVTVAKSRITDDEIRLRFDIAIRNSGRGRILSPDSFISAQSTDYPEVGFSAFVNQAPISCTGVRSGSIELRQEENERVIKCTSSITLDQDYIQVPFNLRLRYGYLDTVLGPRIKLIGEENSLV